MLKQKPFTKYNLEKKLDSVTLRLNPEERERLEKDKKLIEQSKDSTAIKTVWMIGSIVLHDKKMAAILSALFKNKRNNERLGIPDFE